MHQLNLELLEQLNVACNYLLSNNVLVPNRNTFASLLRKAWALMDEIKADEPKIIQYTKLTDEKKHLFRTDEDVPVPNISSFKCECIREWTGIVPPLSKVKS